MNEKEELFDQYFNSINETLEQTVKFHSFSKYCRKIDYLNNKDYEGYITFIDNLFICSNYARISLVNKLIDKSGFSFLSLMEHIRENPEMFGKNKEETTQKLIEVDNALKVHDKLIEILRKQRNKFHAHLDKKLAGSEDMYNVFFEYEVKEEELDNLIITLCNCIVKINFIFNETYGSIFINNILNEENLYTICEIKKVFDQLRKTSSYPQPNQIMTNLYYENLTKHY